MAQQTESKEASEVPGSPIELPRSEHERAVPRLIPLLPVQEWVLAPDDFLSSRVALFIDNKMRQFPGLQLARVHWHTDSWFKGNFDLVHIVYIKSLFSSELHSGFTLSAVNYAAACGAPRIQFEESKLQIRWLLESGPPWPALASQPADVILKALEPTSVELGPTFDRDHDEFKTLLADVITRVSLDLINLIADYARGYSLSFETLMCYIKASPITALHHGVPSGCVFTLNKLDSDQALYVTLEAPKDSRSVLF